MGEYTFFLHKISDSEWWKGWIQLWYIVRTFVNDTVYPQYNSNNKKISGWSFTQNKRSRAARNGTYL
jgi:hypothetical protein